MILFNCDNDFATDEEAHAFTQSNDWSKEEQVYPTVFPVDEILMLVSKTEDVICWLVDTHPQYYIFELRQDL